MFKTLKQKIAGFIHKPAVISKPKKFVPFDLAIGSHLKIDTNLHIIYKSRCTLPPTNTVTSIGRCILGDSKIFRFYFNDSHFLQVIINLSNQIEECRLFSLMDTVYPSTMAAWGEWLAENTGRIGAFEFTIDYTDVVFVRMSSWADDEPSWVPPVSFTEDISKTNDDINNITIIHQAMAYGRWLNEDKQIAEYLLVSSDSSTHFEAIRMYVGIDVNPNEVVTYF